MVFYFIFKENFLLILEWDFVWRNLCYGFYIRLKTGYKCNAFSQLQVQGLKRELSCAQKSRKAASASLRMALQKAAQLRLMEKEKNKSPSYAMRISLQINKVVWSMLVDGKSFAEAEINDLVSIRRSRYFNYL